VNESVISTVGTRLGIADRFGRLRVRLGVGRGRYSVAPGLYKVGTPNPSSPVLVTANYKLTFDVLRSGLEGVDVWILVLDTKGVNVWCAAGKGTFGTEELIRRVQVTGLSNFVSHRRLVIPQLGATGVAGHEVHQLCGFRVVYGPVRAGDIKAFLAARMKATERMRRVTFTLGERLAVIGVELVSVLKWIVPIVVVMMLYAGGESISDRANAVMPTALPILAGVLAGVVLVPILLPWIPGRAFSLKGAILGALAVGTTLTLMRGSQSAAGAITLFLAGTTAASFLAMQFTGSTTFTSPSGVEWEMRRALPIQISAVSLAIVVGIADWIAG
jgi:hypothetical protein